MPAKRTNANGAGSNDDTEGLQRYIVLLGGINVGKRQVKMERLREILSGAGYADVETFIASGNAILRAPAGDEAALEDAIAALLERELGFPVFTTVRTVPELAQTLTFEDFPALSGDEETVNVYISFAREPFSGEVAAALTALETDEDALRVKGREFYWRRLGTLSTTSIKDSALKKALGQVGTQRNVTSVRRMVDKYAED